MFLLPAVIIGIGFGYLLGGRLGRLADVRLAQPGLFYLAIGLQIVAFSSLFGSHVPETMATVFSVGSYGCLLAVFVLNRRLTGMPIAGLGMLLNLVASRHRRPHAGAALCDARRRACLQRHPQQQRGLRVADAGRLSIAWAAPSWAPMANVYSVGDVLIGLGAAVIVAAAMGARVPLRGQSADAAATPDQG